MASPHDETLRRYENRLAELDSAHYLFTLFVAGASDLSRRAIANILELFEYHLTGRYDLEVVDVYRDRATTAASNVLAAPTLIRESPLPKRRLVGDLSDTARVLRVLGVSERAFVSRSR
ncbi:MAG TPA: circadian clock KaiB family protein [Acidothermaceae bacterium]|jgi:circadian clock protein KaiB